MALRRVVLAAAALSIAALAVWAAGMVPGGVPGALGIRSMTVDAPFQAPEPTAEPELAPGVIDVEAVAAPVDARIALLALVAIVGFGAGMWTLRAASSEGTRRST